MQPRRSVRQRSGPGRAPAAAAADDASAPLPPLLQLCPELLQLVWKHLGRDPYDEYYPDNDPNEDPEPRHPDQHALYSTCKAARQATSALINRLHMNMSPAEKGGWKAGLQKGLRVLSRLPRWVAYTYHYCILAAI